MIIQALLKTITRWPHEIYDVASVLVAIQDQLERKPGSKILMECLAELFAHWLSLPSRFHADLVDQTRFILNQQPGKALPYYLKLRRPGVFNLIRENNLFTDVQDQALLLIEFDRDMELLKKRNLRDGTTQILAHKDQAEVAAQSGEDSIYGTAITLLIDHTHSIPVRLFFLFSLATGSN